MAVRESIRDLTKYIEPRDLQVAHMYVAGMSPFDIAKFFQVGTQIIQQTLASERLQRYILQIRATFAQDLVPFMEEMRETLEEDARKAREIQRTIMDESFHQRDDIKWAKMAVVTAQDILDRAGVAAPKKIETSTHHSFGVDQEMGSQIIEILKEDDQVA